MLKKIISGGQTGADQGFLGGAWQLGIAVGGTAPKRYMTETGPNPILLGIKYGLKESPYSDYAVRTRDNARDADGTVWIGNTNSPGFRCTKKANGKKPWIENPTPEKLAEWVEENNIEILNGAGNRESKNPGIHEKARLLVIGAFGNGKTATPE